MTTIHLEWWEEWVLNIPLVLIYGAFVLSWIWPSLYRWYVSHVIRHWSHAKIAGYLLGKCVDETPVMTRYGKFDVAEMEEIEVLKRGAEGHR